MSKLKWECKYLSYNFTIPFYTLSTAHYWAWKRLYICCHYEYEKMSGNRQWCGKVFLVLEQFFLFSKHNTLKSFYIIFLLKKMNILNIFEDEKRSLYPSFGLIYFFLQFWLAFFRAQILFIWWWGRTSLLLTCFWIQDIKIL